MQVNGLNIPFVSDIPLNTHGQTERQTQKQSRATDSYSRNARSAQVIDAEYVDLYSAPKPTTASSSESITLTDISLSEQSTTESASTGQKLNGYLKEPVNAPLPGSLINYYA